MIRAIVVGVLICMGVHACSKDSAPAVATSAAAGTVVEASGKVNATRNGATRSLATGNEVFADDVVETASDGSVVIELTHNNARWSLEGGQKSRVDESVAFGLEKQAKSKVIEHATSAAGRHADRQAAETKESAVESAPAAAATVDVEERQKRAAAEASVANAQSEAARAAAKTKLQNLKRESERREPPKSGAPSGRGVTADANDPLAGLDGAPRKDTAKPPPPPAKDSKSSSSDCDEVSCVINGNAGPCCAKFKKAGGTRGIRPSAAGGGALLERLDQAQLRDGIAKVKDRVKACGEKFAVKGVVKVELVVGADGNVSRATIKESPDPELGTCVAEAVKQATFAKSRAGATVSYPFSF
jgi:hypothetical protein